MLLLHPFKGARDRFQPALVMGIAGLGIHLGIPFLVLAPVRPQILDFRPEPNSQASRISGAQGGGLRHGWPDDRHTQDIGLELHQQFIVYHTAIYLESGQVYAGILVHGVQDFASLEGGGFQTREVLDAMNKDSGLNLTALKVDGGMVYNELLMQFQADILGVPVIRPTVAETTSLGAAYAAGLAVR